MTVHPTTTGTLDALSETIDDYQLSGRKHYHDGNVPKEQIDMLVRENEEIKRQLA